MLQSRLRHRNFRCHNLHFGAAKLWNSDEVYIAASKVVVNESRLRCENLKCQSPECASKLAPLKQDRGTKFLSSKIRKQNQRSRSLDSYIQIAHLDCKIKIWKAKVGSVVSKFVVVKSHLRNQHLRLRIWSAASISVAKI